MSNDMKTSEVINRAADLIEERGWTKGAGWDNDGGPLCLEGAIFAASGVMAHARCPAYVAVSDYLASKTDLVPFLWNDRLSHEYLMAAITNGEYQQPLNYEELRAESLAFAKGEVIATLRAAALVEAAKENAEVREADEVAS